MPHNRLALRALLILALGGPLAGALLFCVPFLFPIIGSPAATIAEKLAAIVTIYTVIAGLAFVVGGIPAALTGVLVGLLVRKEGAVSAPFVAVVASVAGLVGSLFVGPVHVQVVKGGLHMFVRPLGSVPQPGDDTNIALPLAFASAGAALLLVPILRRAGVGKAAA
jgi:hypothetical protein